MTLLKSTIIKKSTSDNMKILINKVLDGVIKSDPPIIKKNVIKWGGYTITFNGNNWSFLDSSISNINEGRFPSGLGHVSLGIKNNINITLK